MRIEAEKNGGWRRSPWRLALWGMAALLLLLPLIAMRFTEEVNWDATDFFVMGAMLAMAFGAFDLAAGATGSPAYRAAAALAILAAFLLVWVNLAVGFIGSEDNPLNLMFAGVLAIGLIGVLAARFEPRGMARAMTAMALAQLLAGIIALLAGYFTGILAGFFAALWLVSAWLFRQSARDRAEAGATP